MSKINLLLLLCIGCLLQPLCSYAQPATVQFEQTDSLQKSAKRTVVVFIHTGWCNYCKAMQNTTFKDKNIIRQLNNNFYFIDFDAEEKRTVFFNGQKFTYQPTGNNTGIHQLAEQLATVNNKIFYPTLCFLNDRFEIIFQTTEYQSKAMLEKILAKLK
jgi:thioredoxin-related protein